MHLKKAIKKLVKYKKDYIEKKDGNELHSFFRKQKIEKLKKLVFRATCISYIKKGGESFIMKKLIFPFVIMIMFIGCSDKSLNLSESTENKIVGNKYKY